MPDRETPPLLTGELSSLARDQLKMQTSRSVALDAGALGLMVLDTALATSLLDSRGTYDLWIAALALFGLSFALAIRALRHKGAKETGPFAARLSEYGETHDEHQVREMLRAELTEEVDINDHALARKAVLLDRALTPLVLATLIDLAGRL
jgi:hypothetical protein